MSQMRGESAADVEVAAHLSGLGLDTTPREVRTWRADVLLDRATRRPQGYARTVISENTPGTLERAEALARLTGHKRMSKRDRVLTLFFGSEDVQDCQLRWALSSTLRDLDAYVREYVGGCTDPLDLPAMIQSRVTGKKPRGKFLNFIYGNVAALPYTPEGMTATEQHAFMSSVGAVLVSCMLGLDVYKLATADTMLDRDAIDETVDTLKAVGLGRKQQEEPENLRFESARSLAREHLLAVYDGASLLELADSADDYSYDELRWLADFTIASMDLARFIARNERRLKAKAIPSGMAASETFKDTITSKAFNTLLAGKRLGSVSESEKEQAWRRLETSIQLQRDWDALLNFVDRDVHRILGAGEDWPQYSVDLQNRAGEGLRAFSCKHGDVMERIREHSEAM